MVSSQRHSYRADIVRLINGNTDPNGPGFKEKAVKTPVSGTYRGRPQRIPLGSYVEVPDNPLFQCTDGFTLQAWLYPTTPRKGIQGVLTRWVDGKGGYGLFIEDGGLALRMSDASGKVKMLRSGKPLRTGEWYFAAATYDPETGQTRLYQEPLTRYPMEDTSAVVQGTRRDGFETRPYDVPFLMAGHWQVEGRKRVVAGHYNGKIESPRIYGRALAADEIEALRRGASVSEGLLASWDFTSGQSSDSIVDTSPNRLHGHAVNTPTRAMTGHTWTGEHHDFKVAPHQYGAIHFHDDDLEDCRWEEAFQFTVPKNMRSGVYAARLKSGSAEDYVPFYVVPKAGKAQSRIAYLFSTNTYLAYGNEQTLNSLRVQEISGLKPGDYPKHPNDRYIVANGLRSLYDHHTDGSGVCYFSRLQPIVNMRPKVNMPFLLGGKGGPHSLNADLMLVDWMERKGFAHDVLTDEDLHFDGLPLLSPYKVVLTGCHPEYWTGPMLDALEAYLAQGGRLMYLGGNGFYWVTSINEKRPHVIEVRRPRGTAPWLSQPGEHYHSTTGELAGHWRARNRAPQKVAGIGFTAQGFDRNRPYKRMPGSLDPRAAFIFESVGKDELIGDFPSLMLAHGAAGHEIDRMDHSLGTPPHTLLLAAAMGYTDAYQHVVEELAGADSKQGGTVEPRVRSDMVFFETPNGGAVFSVGSISYIGSLSYNNYDNNVSRITENVLRRFASEEAFDG
jgi:N,N-dimethylformamidase